jgi:hypothetical protein
MTEEDRNKIRLADGIRRDALAKRSGDVDLTSTPINFKSLKHPHPATRFNFFVASSL